MSIGLLFWILMLIWLVFDVYLTWPAPPIRFGGSLLLFILLVILGWHAFGAPIK